MIDSMKRRIKISSALLIAVMLLGLMTGCGQEEEQYTSPNFDESNKIGTVTDSATETNATMSDAVALASVTNATPSDATMTDALVASISDASTMGVYDNNTYFSARLLRMKNKDIKKGHTYLVTINATASEDAVIDAVAFALNGDTWKDLGGDWHRSEAVQKDLPFSITFNCPVHTKPGKKDEVDVWVRFLASPDSTITDLILSNIEVTWTDAAKAAKKSRRD